MSIINLARADKNVKITDPVQQLMFAFLTGPFNIGSTGFNIPNQIPFNSNFNSPSDPVQALSNGDVIFNEIGTYIIKRSHVLGRINNNIGEIYVYGEDTINGVSKGYADFYKSSPIDLQFFRYDAPSLEFTVTNIPTTFRYFMWCDNVQANASLDAWLLGGTPNFPGGVNSPSFQIIVEQTRSS
jgi:hypothetical protein